MQRLEQLEFRRTLIVSIIVHALLIALVLSSSSVVTKTRKFDFSAKGPMNVMWARTVQAPKATRANKLPGPVVAIPAKKVKTKAKAKHVMPKDLKRQRAMKRALASIQKEVSTRPTPKPENFPSKGAKEKGLPGSPGGMVGMLGGDPAFGRYKAEIQRIITDHFVWIREQQNVKAVVTFMIDRNGYILEPAIDQTSGYSAFDAAALRATRKSSPLPPPPNKFANDLVKERFVLTFEPKKR